MYDLISRQEAIDAIWSATPSDELVQGAVEEEIWNLPSVEPEWKKRKWRHYEGQWICEVCHAELDESSPFCPMCGADMRGDHDADN